MRVSEIPGIYEMSTAEKITLVEELWDSIVSDQKILPLTDEQKAELDKRIAGYDADKNPGRLAGEVIDDIQRRL